MTQYPAHLPDFDMAQDKEFNGLRRQEAVRMDELVTQFIRDMKLSSGLEKQRVAEVWNEVSGAGRYTLDVIFERGVVTCMISSSVVRNQLYFQRDLLLKKMNDTLSADNLFVGRENVVRNLILR